ncbi:hypothetical protein [Enterobacter ludwigii]|uniref:Uncharacterized protein n=1 Tax=Enterobacter ludwigii TaxID=299767 RepID=A0AAX3LIR3_9ENTR|nr:hypothetical protein [Enterobacter ludwigii]WCE16207.1 hypothetical protein PHA72_27165 [Enterobacter ludwigii]HDT2136657.1 hypothetical protein [Enterobacter roggenkampii]
MNILKSSLFILLLGTTMGSFNAVADTFSSTDIAANEGAYGGAHYGVFGYTDTKSLVNSVKLLDKFGYHSNVVAETLDLNAYQGSVIIFKTAASGKVLSYEDVFAALKKYMTPLKFKETDAIVVKNTPLSVNEGGATIKQSYQVLFDGNHAESSQPFQIPKGGLALTVYKLDGGQLLFITSAP